MQNAQKCVAVRIRRQSRRVNIFLMLFFFIYNTPQHQRGESCSYVRNTLTDGNCLWFWLVLFTSVKLRTDVRTVVDQALLRMRKIFIEEDVISDMKYLMFLWALPPQFPKPSCGTTTFCSDSDYWSIWNRQE